MVPGCSRERGHGLGGPRQPLRWGMSPVCWRGAGGGGDKAAPPAPLAGPDHAWERLGSWWRRAGGRSSLRAGPPRAPGERTPSPEQGAAHPRHGHPAGPPTSWGQAWPPAGNMQGRRSWPAQGQPLKLLFVWQC